MGRYGKGREGLYLGLSEPRVLVVVLGKLGEVLSLTCSSPVIFQYSLSQSYILSFDLLKSLKDLEPSG